MTILRRGGAAVDRLPARGLLSVLSIRTETPTHQLGQLSNKTSSLLGSLQGEQFFELIEDQHGVKEIVVPRPELGLLEEAPGTRFIRFINANQVHASFLGGVAHSGKQGGQRLLVRESHHHREGNAAHAGAPRGQR